MWSSSMLWVSCLYWYGASAVAFVGGSLVPHGGHNFLEAALCGCAIVTGPWVFNFEAQAEQFQRAEALTLVADERALSAALETLLVDPVIRQQQIDRAQQLVDESRGALDQLLMGLSPWLPESSGVRQDENTVFMHWECLPVTNGGGLGTGLWQSPGAVIRSAGIEAHGLNPRAAQAMLEAGVDISAQTSKVISARDFDGLDLVVTVCGHADEHCPVVPARVRKNPLAAPGSGEC